MTKVTVVCKECGQEDVVDSKDVEKWYIVHTCPDKRESSQTKQVN